MGRPKDTIETLKQRIKELETRLEQVSDDRARAHSEITRLDCELDDSRTVAKTMREALEAIDKLPCPLSLSTTVSKGFLASMMVEARSQAGHALGVVGAEEEPF